MTRNFYILLSAIILIAVMFLLPASFTAQLTGGVRDAMAPFITGVSESSQLFRHVFEDRHTLLDANLRLTEEVERLRTNLRVFQPLQQENQELRDMLELAHRSESRLIAARVISRDVNGWWQAVRLNKGTAEGIRVDMPVVTAEGVVGRITSVTVRTADVLFLVDPTCRISARISRVDAFGIVRGQGVSLQGDCVCRMDFILKEADIQQGDEVVTSGLGGVFPAGLVIGYVSGIYFDRSGLYRYVDIVPAVDLRSVNFVFVDTGTAPTGAERSSP